MRMAKSVVVLTATFTTMVVCAGVSTPFLLDLRTGVRESTGVEILTYSAMWDGNANATVTIAQDGTTFVENLTGEGEQTWTVLKAGLYTLTHTTITNGVSGKVETAPFRLTKNIVSLTIGDVEDVTYTGAPFVPAPTVTDTTCGYTLVNGTDYTLAYMNNVNAGTATVTVTGMGNYTGSIQKTFTIARRSISDAMITLGTSLTYNGNMQTQSISRVEVDGSAITYAVSGNTATNAGTYALTVTGTGNFIGTVTVPYTIARKSISGATVTLGVALTYTGTEQNQSVTEVTVDGLSATCEVSANSATDAGTYTLTVTGTGNFTGSIFKQFTVAQKPITDAMVGAVGNVTYTGTAFTPTPVVVDADRGVTLVNGTDYTLSYANNVNAGTATVTVACKGNYTGSVIRSFTIEKVIVEVPLVPYHMYDGDECQAVLEPNDLYTVVTNGCDLSTGVYEVGFELADPIDYRWRSTDHATLLLTSPVTNVVISVGVTEIASEAFYGWSELKTVSIPESVTRIGYDAFEGCSALETVVTNGLVLYQGWCLGFVRTATGETPVVPANGQDACIPEGVRGIAAGAFDGEYGIETVTFPSTLRFVGAGAFRGCTSLEGIVLPDGVVAVDRDAFRNCTYVQELVLPETLKEIGAGAFANCALLMDVTLPDGVLDVGECAFSNCWRMMSASIPYSVTNVGVGAFADCRRLTGVTVPLHVDTMANLFPAAYDKIATVAVSERSVADVGVQERVPPMVPGMFAGCGAMESLTLPEDLAEVSVDAFVGCTNMAAFNLPDTVTNIGARAFSGLEQLTAFTFPTGLVVVGEESFAGCTGLGALALPDGLQEIGERAFYGLSLLARVDIPRSVTNVDEAAFGGCVRVRAVSLPADAATVSEMFPDSYGLITSATVVECAARSVSAPYRMMPSLFEDCAALVAVEMPPSLTSIGVRAFKGCSSLTTAGIPSGVTLLGEEVFAGCSDLSQMALPNGLSALPARAFSNCVSLTEITVPESVTSLGADVFTGCSLMRSVRFVGNAPAYDAAAYGGTDTALVTYVPNGSMGWDGVPTSRALPEFWPDGTTHEIMWWEPNRFMVDFVSNDGVGTVTSQVEQVTGTTYVMPADATRQGAVFGGWWTAAEGGARVTAVTRVALTRPHTFYAHWTFNRYAVVFDANGGDGTMDGTTLTVETDANLPECGFTRAGYAFAGWATEPNGEVVYTNTAAVVNLAYEQGASVTLYAVWEERDWTLADYVDCGNLVFQNDVLAAWTPDWAMYKVGGVSLRSGVISAAEAEGGRTNTTLTTTVVGEGNGAFWWKVNCEEMDEVYDEWYDYAVFSIDGVEIAKIAGDSGWRQVEYTVTGTGSHTLVWTFSRDDYDEDGSTWQNCVWLDGVVWTPTPVTVTFAPGGATEGTAPDAVTRYAGYELRLPGAGTLANGASSFMGWSDGETTYSVGTVYVFGSADVTLTAVWGEKVWTFREAVDIDAVSAALSWTTGGDADWTVDASTGWTNGVSAKSGAVTSGHESWIEATVSGAGTLTFMWNVMGGFFRNNPFAYAKVELDGTQQVQEYNTDGWKGETVVVEGSGPHTVRWTYLRTSNRETNGDCAWLDAVTWSPSAPVGIVVDVGGEKSVTVPMEWIEAHPSLVSAAGGDAEAAVRNGTAANGRKVWECYVLGLDPEVTTNDFKITSFPMKADGTPDLANIVFEPPVEQWNVPVTWKVKGAATLEGPWGEVPAGGNPAYRFFKVEVVLP